MKKTRNRIMHALSAGSTGVFQNINVWLLFFAVQFILACILVFPFVSRWNSMLGQSLSGQELLQGRGANVLYEFLTLHPDTVSMGKAYLVLFGMLYTIISLFFSGGFLGCLIKNKNNSLHLFFENGSRFFLRFLRLLLYTAALGLLSLVTSILLGKLFHLDNEMLKVAFLVIRLAIFMILIFFFNMVSDYAKIITVVKNRNQMWKTGLEALKFVLGNFWNTTGLYCLIGAMGMGLTIVYFVFAKAVGLFMGVLVLFLCQQIFAFSRIGIRLWFFSSQWNLKKILS